MTRSAYDIFADVAATWPERTVLITRERAWTYGELAATESSVAGWLHASGVGPGDRVVVAVRDMDRYLTTFLAIQRLGAVVAPVEQAVVGSELGALLGRIRPSFLLLDEDAPMSPSGELVPGATELRLPEPGGHPAPRPARVPTDAPGAIFLTSGTTGSSRAIVHSRQSLARASVVLADTLLEQQERLLTTLPPQTIGGHTIVMRAITGGDLLVAPGPCAPRHLLGLVIEHAVQRLCVTPAMIGVLSRVHGREGGDTSSVTVIGAGSSPLHPSVAAAAATAFPAAILVNTYGSTELGGPVMRTLGAGGDGFGAIPPACFQVVDGSGAVLTAGEVGSLYCHVEPAALGELAEDGTVVPLGDEEGWIPCGDLAFIDEQGRVHLRGRAGDVAFRGGRNVYLINVEAAIAGHPAVADVTVLASASPRGNDRIDAYVQLAEGADLTEEELAGHCASVLPRFQLPNTITVCDELPRTFSGKVRRAALAGR